MSRTELSYRDRVLGCVLAGAAGDALGAPVEFASIEEIRGRFGDHGIADYAPAFGVTGAVTDDTQMTLFTVEGVLRAHVRRRVTGDVNVSGALHRAYTRWLYTQDVPVPRPMVTGRLITEPGLYAQRAPGNTCLTALRDTAEGSRTGTIDRPLNDSKGCGGVMRAAPVALWPGTPAEIFVLGAESAALTHGHPSGYLAGGALAVLVRQLLHGEPLDAAIDQARTELAGWRGHDEVSTALDNAILLAGKGRPTPEAIAERLGGGWVAEEALAIGVCAALAADDLGDGLRLAVNHSGDSDSTGSICGNILGARDGVDAVPARLADHVELRWLIEPLVGDALAEFGEQPPFDNNWLARYPPE